jgi:YegS/Rv2252/BmrU family lipid kinase
MSIRTATLIFNPKTGRYNSRRRQLRPIEDVAARLESLGVKVDLQLTSSPGEATEIAARAARNGSSDVIVAGGDGTINEAIQGMAGTTARLAIIPRGTGNVLARELRLPLNDEEAVAVVARGKSRTIYLGLMIDDRTNESRHFVLMAGIGLDASVVRGVQQSLKKRIGKGAFWISGLSHLALWNPQPFTLEIDGNKYTATFAAIGKAAKYGGDLAITPGARLDEREFEICIIKTTSRLRYQRLISHAMRECMPRNNPELPIEKTASGTGYGEAPVQIDVE